MEDQYHKYYCILGLNSNASIHDIRRAYKREALKHHPDKNGGNDTRFKEINAAYQFLMKCETEERECHTNEFMNYMFVILKLFYAQVQAQAQAQAQAQVQVQEEKRNTKPKSKSKPKTIVLNVKVSIEDVYNMRVLAYNIKVKRRQANKCMEFESVMIYLPLINYKTDYEFSESGDDSEHPECPRGDIHIRTTIADNDKYYIDDLFCRYDVHTEEHMSLFEYMYGIDRSLTYFNGEKIVIKLPPILELRSNETTHTYVYEIPDKGLPYVDDKGSCNIRDLQYDNIKRGSLFIHFKLHIPEVSEDILKLPDTEIFFKKYFNG
jgi:DnaJ-class molecular chaperone